MNLVVKLRTVSDNYLKLVCLLSTSAYSALEVLHIMRYRNLLAYLHKSGIVVLRLVKEAQLQHGLRHDDYQRYRYDYSGNLYVHHCSL